MSESRPIGLTLVMSARELLAMTEEDLQELEALAGLEEKARWLAEWRDQRRQEGAP